MVMSCAISAIAELLVCLCWHHCGVLVAQWVSWNRMASTVHSLYCVPGAEHTDAK